MKTKIKQQPIIEKTPTIAAECRLPLVCARCRVALVQPPGTRHYIHPEFGNCPYEGQRFALPVITLEAE